MGYIEKITITDPCEILCSGKQRTKADCQKCARDMFRHHEEVMKGIEEYLIELYNKENKNERA